MTNRPLVRWFAGEMEKRLKENDHKSGWNHMEKWEIHQRLAEEMEELTQALAHGGDPIQECADIANFCAFLAWNMRQPA